jgi:hypothetical protein
MREQAAVQHPALIDPEAVGPYGTSAPSAQTGPLYALQPETQEWLSAAGPGGPPVAGYLTTGQAPVVEQLEGPIFPSRRRKNLLLATAGVVTVALLAAITIFATHHSAGNSARTPSPTPAAAGGRGATTGATPSASSARTNSALANLAPITLAEIFPRAQVVADGIKFTRVIAVLNDECSLAARAAFAGALASAGCQRVVRATFVDSARRYAVTVGVAALPSDAAADRVNGAKEFGPDVWFVGLDGHVGSGAATVSKTVGVGYDVVYGRFIIYALATYGDGRNPTGQAAEVQQLKTLSQSFTAMARQPIVALAKS